jgi:hypothetical protein
LILSAVGVRRTKLQLLHPNGGVRAAPLSSALASVTPAAMATAMRGVATSTAIRLRISFLMVASSNRDRRP